MSKIQQTLIYRIPISSNDLPSFPSSLSLSLTNNPERMRNSEIFRNSVKVLNSLWREKSRIEKNSNFHIVRDKLFPSGITGSEEGNLNRAGDKLAEIDEAVGLLDLEFSSFVDLCGGPGAFAFYVLSKRRIKGWGMTLRGSAESIDWDARLTEGEFGECFIVEWGADGTGNLYFLENREFLAKKVDRVNLVVGDGGFRVEEENIQELLTGRLLICEVLTGVSIIADNGNICIKTFDLFSSLSISIVYTIAILFNECFIVKPKRSRITNSERYLVGKGFRGRNHQFDLIIKLLQDAANLCNDTSTVDSLFPISTLKADKAFVQALENCSLDIAERQTDALRTVNDTCEKGKKRLLS